MRILVINYEYPPVGGGGGFVTRDILEQIVAEEHKATIITSHYKGLAREEIVNGVSIIRVPVLFRKKLEVASLPSMFSYLPSSLLKSLSCINRNSYDIINTHFAIPSGPTGYILSKLFHLPNVLTIHGGDIFDPSKSLSPHKSPLLSAIVRSMMNSADRLVAQSNDTKNNAYRYYKVKKHIDIIPLGIKKPVYTKKTRVDFGLGTDERVFCTIGRLIKRKNIDDSLEILSELKNNYAFKFLIIGEGPERLHLEKLAVHLGLESSVLFLGNVSDEVKFQLLDLSDFYLSTASHEGFGLVFLEAMECGLPIICYNQGGQNDFLVNGKTGFLVELGSKELFKESIVKILSDVTLKNTISGYNKNLVKNFYISSCAQRYVSLFKEVISNHGKKA